MALRFCDSFDHYTESDFNNKWTQWSATNAGTIGAFGRNGTNGWRSIATNSGVSLHKQLDSRDEWWCGVAVLFGDITPVGEVFFLNLRDSGTAQVGLSLTTDSRVRITFGPSSVVGSTVLTQDVFYYFELYALIHNSAGAYEVRINEVTEMSDSGVDTQVSANASANQVFLQGGSNTGNGLRQFDDVYVVDNDAGGVTGFLGDVRVQAILPNGNGNSSQLNGSDGNSTDNYLLVDETAADDDTTYVEENTVGDEDTYAFGNLTPTSGDIVGLQILPFARKTDAGTREIATIARHSGSEVDSADHVLATTYNYYFDIRETKPGGGAWSISDVNGAEFGAKVTA